ncbi:MAG TPA: RNA-binding S4 domain-containing protein [Bacillota bacterium]|nr:RNA-binding S4 domain-containing protein [Bacillota bacterium]HPJ23914.1 RNA-binding S4 domain-containing protein [Bacillota bacterium]
MRLDKFLKVSRIFKRRTIAKEVSKNQRITVNGRASKPSTDVEVGDTLAITYGNKELVVKIKEISTYSTKESSENMYEIISERKLN